MRKSKPTVMIKDTQLHMTNSIEGAALELAKALAEIGRAANTLAANLQPNEGVIGINITGPLSKEPNLKGTPKCQ